MNSPQHRGRPRRLARVLFVAALLPWLCGCPTFTVGRRPDPRRLEQLTIGTAAKADVLRQFGPPAGGGRALFPGEDAPRDLWYYYYEEGSMRENQRIFLFLFFSGGVYDGCMWFSSLPPLLPTSAESTP